MSRNSPRIEAALGLLTEARLLADVGCDHGYFPIAAVKAGKARAAIASDNKPSPLETARIHVGENGLSDRISCVLSDGLSHLFSEVDAVSLMGMGGQLIASILDRADLSAVKQLILGPNKDPSAVRLWLQTHGWKISAERFVRDHGHDYALIACLKGEMTLSANEREYGPFILKEKNPAFVAFLERKATLLEDALGSAEDPEKIRSLKERIQALREMIR